MVGGLIGLVVVVAGFAVWWSHDPNPPARLLIPFAGRSTPPSQALGFALDGRSYALNGRDGTTTWDLTTGQPTTRPTKLAIWARAFSPDRTHFAGWSVADQAVIWGDTATGLVRGKFPIACSLDTLLPNLSWVEGNTKVQLVTIDPARTPRVNVVFTCDITDGSSTQRTVAGPGTTYGQPIAYAPDGRTWIYLNAMQDALQCWDSVTNQPIGTLLRTPTTNRAPTARGSPAHTFTPDGQTLIISQGEGRVEFWDLATRRSTRTLPVLPNNYYLSQALRISPDGRILAASGHPVDPTGWIGWTWDFIRRKLTGKTMSQDSGETVLIDLATGQPLARYPRVRFSEFSHDGRRFSTEDPEWNIAIHDTPQPNRPAKD